MRKLAWVAGAMLAATVGGCSMLGRAAFQEPKVSLVNVQVAGLGLTGGSLEVLLDVYNPNHYRLDATHMTYTVALANDSVTLASGALDDHFTVNDNGTQRVKIPVNFTYSGLGAAGRSILNTGSVEYHVKGIVSVGATVGTFQVPYSSRGRFTTTGVNK